VNTQTTDAGATRPLDEHTRRRLVSAADWTIAAPRRRYVPGGDPVPVAAADVVARALDDGLAVDVETAAAMLRERLQLRGAPSAWTRVASQKIDPAAGSRSPLA
jgi:hypothetical protein